MVVHLKHTPSANGTVVSPFGLSSPTLLTPLLRAIEVIGDRCHQSFGKAGFFALILGILQGRDWSGVAGKAHDERGARKEQQGITD